MPKSFEIVEIVYALCYNIYNSIFIIKGGNVLFNKGDMRIIGVVLAGAQDEATSEYLYNISNHSQELGYKLLIFNTFADLFVALKPDDPGRGIYKIINYEMLDAIIILAETIKNQSVIDEVMYNAKLHGVPVVSIMKPLEGAYNIVFNFEKNFREIINHVIEVHNCKRVYFMSGFKGNDFAETRLKCFRDVMAAHGLEVDERGIEYGDFWNEPTYRAMDRWFADKELPKPDAIVCANDSMAIAVCIKLAEAGYRVPEDIIVTGHDGIEAERYNSPRLTNAITNIKGASYCAVDTVDEILNGKTPDKLTEVDSTLVFSESCGCTKPNDTSLNRKITDLYTIIAGYNSFEAHLNSMAMKLTQDNNFDDFRYHLAEYISSAFSSDAWICMAPGAMSPKPLNADELADESTYDPPDVKFFDGDRLVEIFSWNIDTPYVPSEMEFDRQDILPNLVQKLEKYGFVFLVPIFFRNATQGYIGLTCGLDYNALKCTSTFMSYLNMMLEVVKQKFFINAVVSQLKSMYIQDFMTALYNRRGFYSKIKPQLENCISLNYDLMVVSVDMDGLKNINDTYGHSEGDIAIKALSSLLCQSVDANTIVARFGGDEFVVAGVYPDGEATAESFRETIQRKLDAYNEITEKPYKISASIGISITKPDENTNLDALIEIADGIMYRQKAKQKKLRKGKR